jgi:hypothetical protein
MDLKETVRKAMAGRSEMVEKAIDAAVGGVGRAGESLRKQAEAAKARARQLDSKRTTGEAPPTAAPPAVTEVAGGDVPPAGGAAGGPSLRGDLAPPPPADPAAPTG